jgi:hypothetical protein
VEIFNLDQENLNFILFFAKDRVKGLGVKCLRIRFRV